MSDAPANVSERLANRLIESDLFAFEFISKLAEIESWRKEVYRPIYHVHKWWAKRLGSVFRAILLGSALPDSADLAYEFYRQHDFGRLTVFDPFMGSGTTVGEAHKLGFTSLGRDINPVACELVRVALGPLDREALLSAFGELSSSVGERIRKLYETTDSNNRPCDALYYFWVKTLLCPSCSSSVDLFSSYVFARNAYPDRKPDVRVYCPHCANIFSSSVNEQQVTCSRCRVTFDPHCAPANGATATCSTCKHTFAIAKAIRETGRPPSNRLFAKLVLTDSDHKEYLPVLDADLAAYQNACDQLVQSTLALPTLELEDGYNTRQAINYGYKSWRQFFNDRQLLALGWLRDAILQLSDQAARDAMLLVFSGALEFNNVFASYKGEGTGAIRHMFSHHILKPERVPIEGNVWGTPKSSGAFSTLFRSRLLRAIEYRAAPFEISSPSGNGSNNGRRVYGCSSAINNQLQTEWPPQTIADQSVHVSCGDSSCTELPPASVDLIVTDPPFFDNVHYSELADFFFAWQQLGPTPFAKVRLSTRHTGEVQDVNAALFSAKLRTVFEECSRVLRDDGLLVFTYHHSRAEGWLSLAEAILGAGFAVINCNPVKSEMSVAAPKAQSKEPIQLDVILACRKKALDHRLKLSAAEAFTAAVDRAVAKAKRLKSVGLDLSRGDRRVILIGQFLAEISPGRQAEEVGKIVRDYSVSLESVATSLTGETAVKYDDKNVSNDPQLVMLEQASRLYAA